MIIKPYRIEIDSLRGVTFTSCTFSKLSVAIKNFNIAVEMVLHREIGATSVRLMCNDFIEREFNIYVKYNQIKILKK